MAGMIPDLFAGRLDLPGGGHLDLFTGPAVAAEESILGLFDGVVLEGFTGTVTDTAGHKRQYVDGHQVKGDHGGGSSPARASGPAEPVSAPKDHAGIVRRAVDRIKAVGSAVLDTKVGRFLVRAEHALSIVAHKTRAVAEEAAKRRRPPLDEDAIRRLTRALTIADFVGGYVTGAAAAVAINPAAGKVAAFLPSVSALYVAYSTARDPAGTWAAARRVVRDTLSGKAHAHEAAPPQLAEMLAEVISRQDGEWREAVFLAALAETGDAHAAADLADKLAVPPPDQLPAATADDFGGETDAG